MDEVEALLLTGGKGIARDEAAVVHLLHRVAATLRDHRSRMGTLSQDVSRMAVERESRSHPIARAVEALAALTDEQRKQLLDSGYNAELERLKRAKDELELARTATLNEANRVKFALASLLSDDELTPAARQKIANEMARLGSGAGRS